MISLEHRIEQLTKSVRDGTITWAEATQAIQTEFGYSVTHCVGMGIIKTFQKAAKENK